MHIDMHGHVIIRPGELLERAFAEPIRLINDVLVPGTPLAFANYNRYCTLLDWIGDKLGVNPRCIILRGSSKVGFSIAPRLGKAWCALDDGSDLDLAIVDPDYYHTIDREVRHWEHQPQNISAILVSDVLTKQLQRGRRERQFYYYRDYNLPDGLHCKQILAEFIQHAPVEEACGVVRDIDSVFVYRDWLSLVTRYKYDLQELTDKVSRNEIPRAAHHLRPADLTGIWGTLHSNGQTAWECAYRDGAPYGAWQSWYPNGQLQSTGDYQNDKAEGSRIGQWTWYADNGDVQAQGTYQNDREWDGAFKEWDRRRGCYVRVTYENGRRSSQSITLL